MSSRRLVIVFAAGSLIAAAATARNLPSPIAVSPADPGGESLVEARCPTFSWGDDGSARSYELVVYEAGAGPAEPLPVLRRTIAGSARSWTPALGGCLERGGRYAWSIRGIGRKGVSEWSPPSLFQISPRPGRAELEEALAIVYQYLTESADLAAIAPAGGAPSTTSPAAPASRALPEKGAAGSREARPGAAAAPTPGAASLTVDGQIHLAAASSLFKDTGVLPIDVFLWSDFIGGILALGDTALLANSTGQNNTALGVEALRANTEGNDNTAVGLGALRANIDGHFNVAIGAWALASNQGDDPATTFGEGSRNVAVGAGAIQSSTKGSENVAIGDRALANRMEGNKNIAIGTDAMSEGKKGLGNIGIGFDTLPFAEGDYNVAIGWQAGDNLAVDTEDSNIFINSDGEVGDSNTLRIGETSGIGFRDLNRVFIQGIYGTVVGNNYPVCILDTGQLGLCNPLPPGAPARVGSQPGGGVEPPR